MLNEMKSRFLSGKKIFTITILVIGFINAQGITNTLGGNTAADKFIVENNSGSEILTVTGDGNVDVSGEVNRSAITGQANLVPIAYGFIQNDGTRLPVLAISRVPGQVNGTK